MYSGDMFVDNPRLKIPTNPLDRVKVEVHSFEVKVLNSWGVSAVFSIHDFEERIHQFRQFGMNRVEAEKALDDEVFKKLRKQLMVVIDDYMSEQSNRYMKDATYSLQFSQDKKHEYAHNLRYSMRADVRVAYVNGLPVPQDCTTFRYNIHERTDII